jgi:FlaA1/EpsC-like NDP-sugar epimerase
VFGSKGSVLEAWEKQGSPIILTSGQCSRFHITKKQAVELVLQVLLQAKAGELWIPRLPSYCMTDLAAAYMSLKGINEPPKHIGLRGNEKVHEELISHNESPSCKLESEYHFVLEPGTAHGPGGWRVQSGISPNRSYMDPRELREAIMQWEVERKDV